MIFSSFLFQRKIRRKKAEIPLDSVRFQDFASRFREFFRFSPSRAIKSLLKLNRTRSFIRISLSLSLSTNENLVAQIKFSLPPSLPPIRSDKLKRKWSGETWLTQITSNKIMFPNQNSNARLSPPFIYRDWYESLSKKGIRFKYSHGMVLEN